LGKSKEKLVLFENLLFSGVGTSFLLTIQILSSSTGSLTSFKRRGKFFLKKKNSEMTILLLSSSPVFNFFLRILEMVNNPNFNIRITD
jgi:hypothetical protein